MKGLLIVFLIIITNVYSQWQQQKNYIYTNMASRAIDACDSMTAVFYGDTDKGPGFYITLDGGSSWNPRVIEGNYVNDVEIVNKNLIVYGNSSGDIYRSTDVGITWHVSFGDDFYTEFIDYIEMFSESKGVALGSGIDGTNKPTILQTTSYAISWSYINGSTDIGRISGDTWRRVDFINVNLGYFYTSPELQKLYKTTDGGHSWITLEAPGDVLLLKFYNESIGLVSTYPKGDGKFRIYLTTDSGQSWIESNSIFTSWPNDFEFLPDDSNKVWFTDIKGLYYSSDMGKTWIEQKLTTSWLFGRDLVFVDNKHGWLLCDDGVVFYTNNNGGITTDVKDSYNIKLPLDYKLEQNYPNPFNPSTIISYQLPVGGYVVLKLYDILGKEIKTLVNNYQLPGSYNVNFSATGFQSGIYFYRLTVNNFSKTKKMIILK